MDTSILVPLMSFFTLIAVCILGLLDINRSQGKPQTRKVRGTEPVAKTGHQSLFEDRQG